jgi:hypothetical protein
MFTYRLPFFQKPKENGLSAVAVGDWDSCFLQLQLLILKNRTMSLLGILLFSPFTLRMPKAFKHELCIGEPVNEDPEWADTDFMNPSQSDEELSCIDEPGTHDKLRPHFI